MYITIGKSVGNSAFQLILNQITWESIETHSVWSAFKQFSHLLCKSRVIGPNCGTSIGCVIYAFSAIVEHSVDRSHRRHHRHQHPNWLLQRRQLLTRKTLFSELHSLKSVKRGLHRKSIANKWILKSFVVAANKWLIISQTIWTQSPREEWPRMLNLDIWRIFCRIRHQKDLKIGTK